MFVSINIPASTISGSTTNWVAITIPASKAQAHVVYSVGQLIDANGGFACQISTAGTTIKIERIDGVDIAVGGLQIFGQITFDIT